LSAEKNLPSISQSGGVPGPQAMLRISSFGLSFLSQSVSAKLGDTEGHGGIPIWWK
jgi:hypothetical protein